MLGVCCSGNVVGLGLKVHEWVFIEDVGLGNKVRLDEVEIMHFGTWRCINYIRHNTFY